MEKIEIFSPVNKESLGYVEAMNTQKIDSIIMDLEKSFEDFKNIEIIKRATMLKECAVLLENDKERLAKIMAMEISKPYKDALSEIDRSIEMIYYTIEEALRISDEIYDGRGLGVNKRALVHREPLGVVLCIAPFNYPINLSISKIIPALIMGNVVLFKPPTQGSIVCNEMVKILNKALPKNVLEIVTGYGRVIGDHIITHKSIKFINFTGSTNVGKGISNKSEMKGLMLELGGKDAAIVLEDADLEKASSEIVKGAYSYSGQRCTAIKRVLVIDKIADRLVEKIKEKVTKLKVGNPMEEGVYITPLIDSKSADFVENLIKDAIDKGAKLVLSNKREGNIIYPTLLDNVSLDMEVAFEEPFGPVLPIIRVSSVEEAIKIANMSNYGLQSSVFTQNIKMAFDIARKLEVGTVHINNKTQRGPDNFPFFGIKDSGMGVQGIKHSILSMTKLKSIVVDI
ncbi:aldehyde dehydrogenase family protein [Oceanivirga salmonicida]|uniref:aldehyde dehydrogenase family protein n=1 Tax=Oceanivirga salmonicida TaxID=1769291 RepID=UPI0012E1C5F2|nr:aldehyde dehydrogenase family protein [Oceanivirga salmonicida]